MFGSEETKEEPQSRGCCASLKRESSPFQPWFSDDENGRTIDIPDSFAPPTCCALLSKTLCCGVSIFTATLGMIQSEATFYFAYLTSWSVALVVLYQMYSLLNTVAASRTTQTVTWRIKITWILYAIALHTSGFASLLYWPAAYNGGALKASYLLIAPHGLLFLLVLFDGMFVNRIPLRWMHYYGFVFPVGVAYAIWSGAHALFDIGNPNRVGDDAFADDDTIYPTLNWKADWEATSVGLIVNGLVVSPLLYLLLWSLSFWRGRRYVVDPNDQRPTVDDVEEGSIFAQWR